MSKISDITDKIKRRKESTRQITPSTRIGREGQTPTMPQKPTVATADNLRDGGAGVCINTRHGGPIRRPAEAGKYTDEINASQISTTPTKESPYANNFGGVQDAMDEAQQKALEIAQQQASKKEYKG